MKNENQSNDTAAMSGVDSSALLAEYGRAVLTIDGNCGCALLGENLQEGEAEFVEIEEGRYPDTHLVACKKALHKLRERLGLSELSYYFGQGHPYAR
jgi:hypothetical protein